MGNFVKTHLLNGFYKKVVETLLIHLTFFFFTVFIPKSFEYKKIRKHVLLNITCGKTQ